MTDKLAAVLDLRLNSKIKQENLGAVVNAVSGNFRP